MIFPLVQDFADALAAMPCEHPHHRILKLLEEAIRRDVHFIERHPTTFFQCMWNTCWWYDCPEAAEHYEEPVGGWASEGAPWERPGPRLSQILESQRRVKDNTTPQFTWIRSLRPPTAPLGAAFHISVPAGSWSASLSTFSADGKTILTADGDSVLTCVAQTGREVHRLSAREPYVDGADAVANTTVLRAIRPAARGSHLVIVTNKSVRLVDSKDGH